MAHPDSTTAVGGKAEPNFQQNSAASSSTGAATSNNNFTKHHRRLSSTGKTRRRMSDAREAANRPSPSLLTSGLSLANLSLSPSSPTNYPLQLSTSLSGASRRLAPAPASTEDSSSSTLSTNPNGSTAVTQRNVDEEGNDATVASIPSNGRTGKKRGVDHKCETCSKIYRHPSCLIKHRWEHTPHWREASKFVLSKHQQVQLLEAAAILSHMSPSATGGKSLPEDRSLWPSFLSGGSLPPPDAPMPAQRSNSDGKGSTTTNNASSYGHSVSSSVPARAMSTGPRLYDYGVSNGAVTQVRPGLVGVTTGMAGVAVITDRASSSLGSQPVPVPGGSRPRGYGYSSLSSDQYRSRATTEGESWDSPHSYAYSAHSGGAFGSYTGNTIYSNVGDSGGISLPNSSVRGGSSPPRSDSRSRSGSVERSGRIGISTSGGRQTSARLGDDSPLGTSGSDDGGVFDEMDGVEDTRDQARGIVIVGESDNRIGLNASSRPYEPFSGRYGGYGYPTRSSYGSYPGRFGKPMMKKDDEDDLDYRFAVREEDEDEDMDEMDAVGRLRHRSRKSSIKSKVTPARRVDEHEWDGMEMDMVMD